MFGSICRLLLLECFVESVYVSCEKFDIIEFESIYIEDVSFYKMFLIPLKVSIHIPVTLKYLQIKVRASIS